MKTKQPLTEKQMLVYQFIQEFMTQYGFAPSLYEIGMGIKGISNHPSAAYRYLVVLQEKGWIKRKAKARYITIL